MTLADFHFIRPLFLLGIPLVALLIWRLAQRDPNAGWQGYFNAAQLRALTLGRTRRQSLLLGGLATAWVLTCVALAGPTWEQRPTPAGINRQALVILLDQSPSMLATDLTPDRLTRAKLKLIDLLRARQDGETALVAYAATPHLVAPMTEDARTIEALLPALTPHMMPQQGSNTEAAFELALELIANAGYESGDILLITDGVAPVAQRELQRLNPGNIRLSVLGVGTPEGAPIPSRGGFLRDARDQIIVARLNEAELQSLTQPLGGRYTRLQPTEADIQYLLDGFSRPVAGMNDDEPSSRYDEWYDLGYWLCLLLLPFALYAWRRGLVFGLVLGVSSLGYVPRADALEWKDLWLRPDQQGQAALQQEDYDAAAQSFESPEWKGYAQYRAGDYGSAAESLSDIEDAESQYNLGNSLARQGELEEAIYAYNRALLLNPDHQDAEFNRDMLQDYLDHLPPENQSQAGGQGQGDSTPQQQEGENSSSGEQQDQSQPSSSAGNSGDNPSSPQDQEQQAQEQSSEGSQPEDSDGEQGEQSEEEQQGAGSNAESEPEQQEGEEAELGMESGDQPLSPGSEQWLRAVPDDPSGLLRRKFQYQSELYRRQQRFGLPPIPSDDEARY